MSDVVIAFAAEDRGAAKACGEYLSRLGFKVDYSAPAARRSRPKAPVRPEVMAARAVVVIWSEATARLRALHQEAEVAAATGRLIGVHVKANPPARLAGDLQSFIVGPVSELQHVAAALAALGVPFRVANSDGEDHVANVSDEPALAERAWEFADGRGDPQLIHHFLRRFPSPENAARARVRLAELAGADEPDGKASRPLMVLGGMVGGILAMVGLFFLLVPQRPIETVYIAAAGSDGAYRRLIDTYNDHLRPYGLQLKPFDGAKSSFDNVRKLMDGEVPLAFIKGGFAGALRDPEFMTDQRMRDRGTDWKQDWTQQFGKFNSLGRVALEPLWVFTYGSSERNRLSEFNREPINVGTLNGGTRTLAAMLLERNKVRFQQELWQEWSLDPDKIDDKKPLKDARAMFLLQPGETKLVQELLKRVAPEKQVDESSIVRAAVYSPDGQRIVVALGDDTARIWDVRTGKELALLKGHQEEVNDADFSPDGKLVATASDDNTIGIWNAETGALIARHRGDGTDLNSVAFSPDSKFVIASTDADVALVLNVQTGATVLTLRGHEDDVVSADYSLDGKRIITASRDGTAIIWNAANGQPIHLLEGHEKSLSYAFFSPDSKTAVTASWDNTARLWDVETGKSKIILKGHDDNVRSAEFSPDGKRVVTASWDDTARIWDATTGSQIAVLNGLRSNVTNASFSPDGKFVMTASEDGNVRLWNVETWDLVGTLSAAAKAGASKGHVNNRRLHIMNFKDEADAYTSRYTFFSKVELPQGAVALEPHVPAHPVTMLATTVAIVVDKDWAARNKSAVRAIVDAIIHKPLDGIDEITRKPRMFYRSGQFPSLSEPEYQVSPLAPQVYKSGDMPYVLNRLARHRWIPFTWAAWVDENIGTLLLALVPVLGLLIPLSRAVPAIYKWSVRRRLLYWYRRLQSLEQRLDFEDRISRTGRSTPEIERIDSAVSRIKVPLSYSDQYYDLRAHIDLVRQRLEARVASVAAGDGPPRKPGPG